MQNVQQHPQRQLTKVASRKVLSDGNASKKVCPNGTRTIVKHHYALQAVKTTPKTCLSISQKMDCFKKASFDQQRQKKLPVNDQLRRLTSRPWMRKSLDESSKKQNRKSALNTDTFGTKVIFNKTVPRGARPVLKMPVVIPRNNVKMKYVVAVVGDAIKCLEPARSKRFRSGLESHKISMVSKRNPFAVKTRKSRKKRECKVEDSSAGQEVKNRGSDDGRECLVTNPISFDCDRAECASKDEVKMRQVIKFTDRRTKVHYPSRSVTGEEALLEKMDPISNILATEYVGALKRCPSLTDFVTTSHTSDETQTVMSKELFYDSTVMEELKLPLLRTCDTQVPDFHLVPRYETSDGHKSLSFPRETRQKTDARHRPLHKMRKKLKFETILSTRPKGFHRAEWFENVSESSLKTKLVQDVVMSQVKKCLKNRAELRRKAAS